MAIIFQSRRYFFVAIVLLASLAGCSGLFIQQPSHEVTATPESYGMQYENIEFLSSTNSQIRGWYLPSYTHRKGSVLYLQAAGQSLEDAFAVTYWLPAAGYSVLLVDYQGSLSGDAPKDLDALVDDVERSIRYLVAKPETDIRSVVIVGEELGATLAISALSRRDDFRAFRAIALASPFASYAFLSEPSQSSTRLRAALRTTVGGMLKRSDDASDAILRLHGVPILFLHGDSDHRVPVEHAALLMERSAEPKEIWTFHGESLFDCFSQKSYRQHFLELLAKLSEFQSAGKYPR